MHVRPLRATLALLATCTLAACGGDDATAPGDDAVPSAVLSRIDAVSARYPRDVGPLISSITSSKIRQAMRHGARPAPVAAMGPGWSGLVFEDESRRATTVANGMTFPSDTMQWLNVVLFNEAGDVLLGMTARSMRVPVGMASIAFVISLDPRDRVRFGREATLDVTDRAAGAACTDTRLAPPFQECRLGRWTVSLTTRGWIAADAGGSSDTPFERRNLVVPGVRRVIDLTRGP